MDYNPKNNFVNHASKLLDTKLYNPGTFRGESYSELFIRGTTRPEAELNGKGNLHLAARPYRRQLYTQRVREVFPYWDGNGVGWVNEFVDPLMPSRSPD